jgi:hypothetical protein
MVICRGPWLRRLDLYLTRELSPECRIIVSNLAQQVPNDLCTSNAVKRELEARLVR